MTILYVIIGLLLGGGIVWLLLQNREKNNASGDSQSFLLIQNQLSRLTETLDSKLSESTKTLHESVRTQFGESAKIIRDVTRELTEVKEAGKQMVSLGDQLKNLQDILKNPKQRGVLGEYYLEALLKNVLSPAGYQMQYAFRDGTIVDAVVFVKDKIIPVDSKFSLENYHRLVDEQNSTEKEKLEKVFVNDLKLRIQETSKYIKPEEGTLDFAFMFIPHEAIYYDLLVNKISAVGEEESNLIQKAAIKYKVIVVSPTSFLAYLQTVLQGLKALHIEEKAQDIIKRVTDLGKHIGVYEQYFGKLGTSLGTTVGHYNSAYRELKKIDKDVARVTGVASAMEPLALDKPDLDE